MPCRWVGHAKYVVSIGEILPEPRPPVPPLLHPLVPAAGGGLCAVPELLAVCRSVSLLRPHPPFPFFLFLLPSFSGLRASYSTNHFSPYPLSVLLLFPSLLSFAPPPPSGQTWAPWLRLGSFLAVCVFLLARSAESVPLMEGWLGSSLGGAGRHLWARGVPKSGLGWPSLWPGRIRKTQGSSPSGVWGRAGPRGRPRRRDDGRTFCRQYNTRPVHLPVSVII